ncbi:hypothetical protein PVAP13_7NG029378 [Panicum virgatum]|uniref:Uncharacterized protein n=1 Tax=Panicum virgatum TaxID=38727 RepID=A0A8T0PR64_PANVG|nr:hypothetical protein PVAP13_7NG029378 [Panicum virgatum]
MRPRGVRPQIHGSPAHTVSFTPADLDLRSGRFGDHSVRRVFLDPCSKHCFATVIHPGGAEMCYHHSRWGHRAHMLMGLWQSSRPLSWQSSPLSVDFVQTLIPFLFLIFLICSLNFVDLVVQKQESSGSAGMWRGSWCSFSFLDYNALSCVILG